MRRRGVGWRGCDTRSGSWSCWRRAASRGVLASGGVGRAGGAAARPAAARSSRSSRPSPRCCSRSAPGRRWSPSAASTPGRPRWRGCRGSARCSTRTSSGSSGCGPTSWWSTGSDAGAARASSSAPASATFPYVMGGLDNLTRTMRELGRAGRPTRRRPSRRRRRLEARFDAIRARVAGPAAAADAAGVRPRAGRAARDRRERRRRLPRATSCELAGGENVLRRREARGGRASAPRTILAAAPEVIIDLHYGRTLSPDQIDRERAAWKHAVGRCPPCGTGASRCWWETSSSCRDRGWPTPPRRSRTSSTRPRRDALDAARPVALLLLAQRPAG